MPFAGVLDCDPILGWMINGRVLSRTRGLPRSESLDGDWFLMTDRCLKVDHNHAQSLYESLSDDVVIETPPRIHEMLSPNDIVFGLEPNKILTVKVWIPPTDENDETSRSYMLCHPKLWGIKGDNANSRSLLLDAFIFKAANFLLNATPRLRTSYAGTAMTWWRSQYEGKEVNGIEYPTLNQLPHAWREIAHAAFHGGPIACLRGGSEHAVEIDITGAYLDAMAMELPNLNEGSYSFDPDRSWSAIKTHFGFVEALVNVPEHLGKGLPPLPLANGRGTIYPTGMFRGVWSIELLRYAEEECGVQVIHTYEHACFVPNSLATGPMGSGTYLLPMFRELANTWFQIPDKDVAKPLYTRFWGKWGNRGGYSGMPANRNTICPDGAFPTGGFIWSSNMTEQTDDADQTYRPDISAAIAAKNQIAVHRALRMLKPESIIAVHVDAIWTDDVEGAQRVCDRIRPSRTDWDDQDDHTFYPGTWRIKTEGRDRHLACGVYAHGGSIGHSGLKGRPDSEDQLIKRFTRSRDHNDMQELAFTSEARYWIDNKVPLASIDARSIAPNLHDGNFDISQRVTRGIPIDSGAFNPAGWLI